jgi:hypothetical protein
MNVGSSELVGATWEQWAEVGFGSTGSWTGAGNRSRQLDRSTEQEQQPFTLRQQE